MPTPDYVSTLEAGVVTTLELTNTHGWWDPIGTLEISTDGDDIWVTTGQRAPQWAMAEPDPARVSPRRFPPDPGPDVPGAHLVTLDQLVRVGWLVDAMNPTIKLWSAGTPGYRIAYAGPPRRVPTTYVSGAVHGNTANPR